jgi:outer membrane protein
MKMKLFATLFAALMLAGIGVNAQVKIGYTNIDFVLSNIPDSKEIQTKLATEKAQYDKLLQEKIASFQSQYEDYQKNSATMSAVIRQDKEKTLQTAQVAIDAVAKANGYTHVFNSDAGYGTTPVILVAPEEDNITSLVFKQMGVKEPATPAAGN